jgi:hypothetical protein
VKCPRASVWKWSTKVVLTAAPPIAPRTGTDEVCQLVGPAISNWARGKLYHGQFEHALAPLADNPTRAQMTVGRLARSGSAFSPLAASYRAMDFWVTSGASFRTVLQRALPGPRPRVGSR